MQPSTNHVFVVELLGGLRVRQGDEVITRFRTQKTGALLAYLACFLDRAHAREEITDLLWPDVEIEAGRTSLRTALASLRRQLEPPGLPEGSALVADRQYVRLNERTVTTDVLSFETAIKAAARNDLAAARAEELASAVALYRGPLLPGYYDDWVLRERGRLQQILVAALRDLVHALEAAGDPARAIEYAHRVIGVDPLIEEAHTDLMRLYAATRQYAAMRRQYRELERLLQEELDTTPSAATRGLLEVLSRQEGDAGAPPARFVSVGAAGTKPAPRALEPGPAPEPVRTVTSLPLQLTRFFGREQELAELERLLVPDAGAPSATRIVTLTGAGGSGKTRLAVELAARLTGAYAGHVWFVPLADVADPALIGGAIARALRLPAAGEDVTQDVLDRALETFAGHPSLLVLDNFEQLAEGGGATVLTLLERSPSLVCLVTSRQRLDIGGEREVPVAPLPVPVMPGTPEQLAQFASVQLFLDRARAVRPDFQITRDNAPAIAALCEQLDGIPLALELAAAWAAMLTPAQMLSRLSHRFDLLTSRRRDLAPRHRTLRSAIEWSYRLLPLPLRHLFAALSVFRAGWTIDAAEAVLNFRISVDDGLSESEASPAGAVRWEMGDVFVGLTLLRERSLIVAEEADGEMRFRMLETLRAYAAEELSEEVRIVLEQRHAAYYVQMAEAAEPHVHSAEQMVWMDRLDADRENVRAALESCRAHGKVEAGLRLAGAIVEYWELAGRGREGRRWLEDLLALAGPVSESVRAKALFALGVLTVIGGDFERVEAYYDEAIEIYRRLGDMAGVVRVMPRLQDLYSNGYQAFDRAERLTEECLALCRRLSDIWGIALSLQTLGNLVRDQGDYIQARSLYDQSLALYRQLGDRFGTARLLAELCYMLTAQQDYEQARAFGEENLALCRQTRNRSGTPHSLWLLGRVAEAERDFSRANALFEESLAEARETGARQQIINALNNMAIVGELQGDYETARQRYKEAIPVARRLGSRDGVARELYYVGRAARLGGDLADARAHFLEALALFMQAPSQAGTAACLEWLADIDVAEGALERAARRIGIADAVRQQSGADRHPDRQAAMEAALAAIDAGIGEAARRAAHGAGTEMMPEEALLDEEEG